MQSLIKLAQEAIHSKFIQNINITLIENVVSKGFNFVVILFLTRILAPENYGKFSFIAIAIIACSTIFDFGMDNTIIRFSSKEKKYDKSIFGLYFLCKIAISLIIVTVVLLLGDKALIAIDKSEIIKFIPIMLIGSLGEYFLLVNDAYFQAIQKFNFRAVVNISRYFASFVYVIILYFTNNLVLDLVLFIYYIPVIVCLIFTFNYTKFFKSFFTLKTPKNILIEIFQYEKWMFFVSIANTLLIRIDIIMLSVWVSFSKIGIYNAAFQLCNIVALLPLALERVMLPRLSEMEKKNIFSFTIRSLKIITSISIILILFIPLMGFLPVLFYGEAYKDAGLILQILLVCTLISFIAIPIDQAFFALGKPMINAISKYSQLILIVILSIITIPKYGYVWAAFSVLIARTIYMFLYFLLFFKEYSSYKKISDND